METCRYLYRIVHHSCFLHLFKGGCLPFETETVPAASDIDEIQALDFADRQFGTAAGADLDLHQLPGV